MARPSEGGTPGVRLTCATQCATRRLPCRIAYDKNSCQRGPAQYRVGYVEKSLTAVIEGGASPPLA